MTLAVFFPAVLTAVLILTSPLGAEESPSKKIPNFFYLEDDIAGGGLPDEDALRNLAISGYKTIVDLRMPEEGISDEKILAAEIGLKYFNIPLRGADIGIPAAKKLDEILKNTENHPVFIHCRSGTRVRLLWNVYKKKAS